MNIFRPLGGSCADPDRGGRTAFACIYADHNPHHSEGAGCEFCDRAGELIIVE